MQLDIMDNNLFRNIVKTIIETDESLSSILVYGELDDCLKLILHAKDLININPKENNTFRSIINRLNEKEEYDLIICLENCFFIQEFELKTRIIIKENWKCVHHPKFVCVDIADVSILLSDPNMTNELLDKYENSRLR